MKNLRAFTLVEILLYITITSMLLMFASSFVIQIWDGTNSVDLQSKQDAQFSIALVRVERELQLASAISSAQSIFQNTSSKIVFTNELTGGTDTLELSADGILQIRRGNGTIDALTTSEAPIEEFWVEVKSLPKRPPAFFIRIIAQQSSQVLETLIALHSLISL